jgi:hypothetical protein
MLMGVGNTYSQDIFLNGSARHEINETNWKKVLAVPAGLISEGLTTGIGYWSCWLARVLEF